ncbi:BatE [Mucinivorans hirudinis]|uniref:BatE n=1 Tax=Mucinivorans hirudinis TaxID=1433126 RepID=A0A060R5T9_9BACT|nr:BatE [Mucinivorans hirudinis]
MKKLLYITIAVFAFVSLNAQQNTERWERANKAYMEDEFTQAILLYEEILSTDEHSAELYYNLGNAYFKTNNLGKAILNYNRALRLNPSNEDFAHNLAISQARTIDKIEPVPQFFIKQWFIYLGRITGTDGWAMLSIIFLTITLSSVVLWLISNRLSLRKFGFYTALIGAVATIGSLIYAQVNYSRQTSYNEAIVMNSAAPVKSSPSVSGKDLFLLHEGTKLRKLQSIDHWSEIQLEDGNKGWIMSTAIEQI